MNNLFTQGAQFMLGVANVASLPDTDLPEICFVGRSNVGKSSLINALFNNSKLARTSKTPGCTQQLNFFDIAGEFIFVDIPGYGYAKASKKRVSKWNQLIYDYLKGRQQLHRVYILIDARMGLKDSDKETIDFLESYGTPCQIIMTKIDKLSPTQVEACKGEIESYMSKKANCIDVVLVSSASKNLHLEDVRKNIAKHIESIK